MGLKTRIVAGLRKALDVLDEPEVLPAQKIAATVDYRMAANQAAIFGMFKVLEECSRNGAHYSLSHPHLVKSLIDTMVSNLAHLEKALIERANIAAVSDVVSAFRKQKETAEQGPFVRKTDKAKPGFNGMNAEQMRSFLASKGRPVDEPGEEEQSATAEENEEPEVKEDEKTGLPLIEMDDDEAGEMALLFHPNEVKLKPQSKGGYEVVEQELVDDDSNETEEALAELNDAIDAAETEKGLEEILAAGVEPEPLEDHNGFHSFLRQMFREEMGVSQQELDGNIPVEQRKWMREKLVDILKDKVEALQHERANLEPCEANRMRFEEIEEAIYCLKVEIMNVSS